MATQDAPRRELPEPIAYTVNEAASAIGLSRRGLERLIGRGELRVVRIGRRVIVPRSALLRMIGDDTVSLSPNGDVDDRPHSH